MKLTYTFACCLKYSLCFCCNDFGSPRQVWIFYSWLNAPINFYRHFPPRCAWHPEQHTAVWIIWGLFCTAGNLNELLISRGEHHIDFAFFGVSTFSRCTSHRDFNFPRLNFPRCDSTQRATSRDVNHTVGWFSGITHIAKKFDRGSDMSAISCCI